MPLIQLILVIALVGLLVWAITNFIPMDARFQQLIYIVTIIVLLLWLLEVFGVTGWGPRLGRPCP